MSTSATLARAVAPPDTVARLLAGLRSDRAVSHAEHVALYGPLSLSRELIDVAEQSGLRGRGGGGFSTGRKLRAVADQSGRPVVVVNGTEGEPASSKDRALLRHMPHLVLDGALAAAAALGAREIVVATSRAGRAERRGVEGALAERVERVRWRVATVPDGFVVGEETALLNALSGKAAKPSVKPPYPYERGLGGAPTLVQNAETLAHLALVARFGAHWFRSLGTEREPGTALVTLSGAVVRPGVYEIELGTQLSELLEQAGGPAEPIDAVLVGGYFGNWTRDLSMRLNAASGLGAGVVIALPSDTCALAECANVAHYLAAESAGQCGPCVHGLKALAGGLSEIAHGGHANRGGTDRLERWAQQVTGRGACRHPEAAANFIASTLATFGDELKLHRRRGGCGHRARGIMPTENRHA